jgi:HK97 family phage prohead protease
MNLLELNRAGVTHDYQIKDNINILFKKEDVDDEGVIRGYGSTFNGKPDLHGDVIKPGAFTETIANNGIFGNGIKFLWQHFTSQPIGIHEEISEDRKGLLLKSRLALDIQAGHDAHVLAKMGAIDSYSIGYKIEDSKEKVRESIRIFELLKLALYEVSLVTFPANPKARVTEVKSAIENAKTERQLENALREVGLSRKAAQYLVSLCKPTLRVIKGKHGEGNLRDVLKTLKEVNSNYLLTKMITDCKND